MLALFSACFTVFTMFSTNPFEDGWYGGTLRWLIPFLDTKWWDSVEEKGGPLSDTNVNGSPCVANITLSLSAVWAAEVEVTTNTSGHFEKAPTATKTMFYSTVRDQHVPVPKDP